ncbi:MAG: sulfatase [Verrucomicrobiaceae bacterium]|nr:sulfatase [Verrucomicrobiaceae bacterium]
MLASSFLPNRFAAMLRFLPLFMAFGGALAAKAPNVVVFLVDDLGQRDIGCYGSSFYETPNVDRLAKEGVKFESGYSSCPVCSPTRSSMLTGRYPVETKVTDYIGAASKPEQWNRNTVLLPAPYQTFLDPGEKTIAEVLKGVGYATMFAGKWHLGGEGYFPEDHGFDINMGGLDRGGPYGGKGYFSPYGNPKLADGPPGEHLPDRLASEVCQFIASNAKKPFFAYFSFYSVHTPLMARPDLQKKYEEKRARLGLTPKFGREEPREVRQIQEHAIYAAMVEAMDLAVGKVLAKLDELDLTQDTLVIFTSDNGGLSTSEGSPTSNLPLRGGKGWLYEGGIRVSWIARWPGKLPAGSINSSPISSVDLLPTVLEACDLTSAPHLSGKSWLKLAQGQQDEGRPLFWHYPHYGNQGGAPGSAVRLDKWKLIRWYEKERTELFNLEADIGETTNLASEQPDKVNELNGLLDAWLKQTHALMPTSNPVYDSAKPDGRAAGVRKPKKGK